MNRIILAGGCFWGVEAYFAQLKGITKVYSGYVNGNKENPTYEKVCSGIATHAEAIYLEFDESIISLNKVLEHYFRIIDPTSLNKQGNDVGIQYRTGIYYYDDKTYRVAKKYLLNIQNNYKNPIVVELEEVDNFYKAEYYHQNYLANNPNGYCHIDLSLAREDEKR
ncbi:MAG: peptide-methionine (S)-S-oxide reductase MsrA [Acholeplasmataceae bacterium]